MHVRLPVIAPFALILSVAASAQTRDATPYFEAPAGSLYASRNPSGVTVLPSGRLLAPRGVNVVVAPHPYGLALSPNGSLLVTSNSGTGPFSLSLLRGLASGTPEVKRIPPEGAPDDGETIEGVFMGVAVAPDNRTIYASGGNDGTVLVLDAETGEKVATIDADCEVSGRAYEDSFTGDLALTADGSRLYVADNANFRVVVIDAPNRQVIASVPVGRYPYAVALSPDERTVYVANIGMFEYSAIVPGDAAPAGDPRGVSFPPFGFPSQEARDGVTVEGYDVPGLGDPNVPESFSVWAIDVAGPEPTVIAKVKTGTLVGEQGDRYDSVGGSSPTALVVSDRYVFVSNGANDNIQAIDRRDHSIAFTIDLCPSELVRGLKGVMPFGLALSPDGRRLYVAESGLNAVGVVDVTDRRLIGHIPVGWFPSRLALSQDGRRLYAANAKGFGAGPNAGPLHEPGPWGTGVGSLMRGSVTMMDVPADHELPELSQAVFAYNGLVDRTPLLAERPGSAVPRGVAAPSPQIKYVVFITKENRTYDEVFGNLPGGRGEPSLARWGADATVDEHEHVNVMPNHRALAETWAVSDNFYMNSDHSADGHRWLVGVPPNVWVETNVSASYGGKRSFDLRTTAPGRLAIFGANSALAPEDYLEDGSLWEHLFRHGVEFRNYGEGFEFAGISEDGGLMPTGARESVNIPMPQVLFERTSREFPTYNMNIPDQYRADQFVKEFNERFADDPAAMPRYLYIYLPNDHGAGARPDSGYPYLASYMADNDLAVGRVVDALSHSRYWPEMAIFITEDDSQSGVDTVDAHRSILLVASPWARRGYVSHRHCDLSSITKTVFAIYGLPPLNLFDALASDLSDCFTLTPDFTPYDCRPVDPRIFDPEKAKDPADPDYERARLLPSVPLDGRDEAERQRPS